MEFNDFMVVSSGSIRLSLKYYQVAVFQKRTRTRWVIIVNDISSVQNARKWTKADIGIQKINETKRLTFSQKSGKKDAK